MNLVRYTNKKGQTLIGTIIGGDTGDYCVNETVNIKQPNDETAFACPLSKVKEINEEEYLDLRYLIYGF